MHSWTEGFGYLEVPMILAQVIMKLIVQEAIFRK